MYINWDYFKAYNQDSRGVRFKFEDLCRQLFANENLSGNKQFRYLHANPNNYGLETEPIYDEVNHKWIGFQAKYFDGAVDYKEIKNSMDKVVEYYTGKFGRVDLVYLFCNRPISADSKSFGEIIHLLKSKKIDLQLITDSEILDLVRKKYSYLGLYYFGCHSLKPNWFTMQANFMFEGLGERYNREFNVETKYMDELSLFVHDQKAADYLNAKKTALLNEIDRLYVRYDSYRSYLNTLRNAVSDLPDVDIESLYRSEQWVETLTAFVQTDLDVLSREIEKLESKRVEEHKTAFDKEKIGKDRDAALKKYQELVRNISKLTTLVELPTKVAITDREKQLLYSQILTLFGRAGTGKSQLLATKTQSLLNEERAALLLVAGIYLSGEPIQEQIIKNLRLEFSFEGLIDVLETIGEKNNCIVPVFIDAINETWHNRLWKTGLPSIVNKIKKAEMVRLVISYRPEYEKQVLPDSMNNNKDVVTMLHRGFEDNSIGAAREFLNHYSIPFTPLEYFGYEMSNPLFLTLYCKTYDGQEVSLPILYDRLIEHASINTYRAHEEELENKGYFEGDNILQPLISQISEYLVNHDERSISRSDLVQLNYWAEYGLAPAPYVRQLIKENILYDSPFEKTQKYFFAFDQMNDYYCAKSIIGMCKSKEEVRQYLSEKVLGIQDSVLQKSWNIDLFVNSCVLYAEKFDEECIDIIEGLKEDDRWTVFSGYINAFQWRNTKGIKSNNLTELLKKYPCDPNVLWSMLIGNSVKVSHPYNADYLHSFLSRYELNRRDYLWTLYINNLTLDESDRINQLVQMYESGEKLEVINKKQIELLLILFSWILTASNRWLRDHTSKAMIEILKEHFEFCKPILEKFKEVNDPYVIQRLYGIVFGACCKRKSGNLRELAEYVYETVFNQDKVYPDILLRDYARLIIEKFLIEEEEYHGVIDREKFIPPYKSDPIPDVEIQHYEDKDYDGAMLKLMLSMRIENMGGYGDFGRYVFQSALHSFDVDDYKMFNYAVYHILNDLGFKEEYFGEHDQNCRGYDRYLTVKTERIGKKYQWITMYNMLARISDNCKMIDHWNYPQKEKVRFEGAWEPFVRDFDPTLNEKFLNCDAAPEFNVLKEHIKCGIDENKSIDISTKEAQRLWLESKGVFIKKLKDILILTDDRGQKWICLTKHCDTGRMDLNVDKLLVWSWHYAYFMTKEQADDFKKSVENGRSIFLHDVSSHQEVHTVFNREYPWSPSCRELEENAWVDAYVKTGETEIVEEEAQAPGLSMLDKFLHEYGGTTDKDQVFEDERYYEEDEEQEVSENTEGIDESVTKSSIVKRQREVEKNIGRILQATTDYIWEAEYDATKENTISISFPCGKLITMMGLKQLKADGFFYDMNCELAAFDTDLTQKINSVVVRKDILDNFLSRTGMKLVWLVDAEKEIHGEDYMVKSWSEWEGVFIYEDDQIYGEINRRSINN